MAQIARILVVEDEDAIALALNLLLAQEGYRSERIATGAEALTSALELLPALVLLDVKLPGTSGYEICQNLRKEAALAGVKILMMTVGGSQMERRKARALGADAVIAKPFDLDDLAAAIAALIGPGNGPKAGARNG